MGTNDDDIDFDKLMRELPDAKAVRAPAQRAPPKSPHSEAAARAEDEGVSAEDRATFLAAVGGLGGLPPKDGARSASTRLGAVDPEKTLASVRTGRAEPDAMLDLHGTNRERALNRMRAFLAQARSEKWRLLRVIVGKGLHSEGGDAVLGPAIEAALKAERGVLAVAKAPARLGGGGALLVVLDIG